MDRGQAVGQRAGFMVTGVSCYTWKKATLIICVTGQMSVQWDRREGWQREEELLASGTMSKHSTTHGSSVVSNTLLRGEREKLQV